ncbi:hypothetical protein AAMO2058_000294100 [Amorphochlora amoebiformis]
MGSSSSKNEDTIRWRLKYEDLKKESETTIRELLVLQEANSRNLRYAYGAAAGLSVVCLAGGIFLGRRVFYSNDLMRSLVGRGVQMQKKIFADELEAVRARGLAETEKAGRFAIRGLAKDLLQVADNLERASIMEAESEGVQMTYRNMSEVLKAHRITPIDIQLGDLEDTKEEEGPETPPKERTPFDPEIHECVATVPVESLESDAKPGQIVEVLSRGWMIDGKVLRASQVVCVADAPSSSSSP